MLQRTARRKTGEHHLKLTTRKQKKDAKDKGDIRGWFGMIPKLPRGRPKKEDKLDSTTTTTTGDSAVSDSTMKRAAPKKYVGWK